MLPVYVAKKNRQEHWAKQRQEHLAKTASARTAVNKSEIGQ
jgi:hypothetical protein